MTPAVGPPRFRSAVAVDVDAIALVAAGVSFVKWTTPSAVGELVDVGLAPRPVATDPEDGDGGNREWGGTRACEARRPQMVP